MSTFQERCDALTGSACLEKVVGALLQDEQSNQDGDVKPVRNYCLVGDHQSALAGDYGTAIAGDSGTACAGMFGIASAGEWGQADAGDCGVAYALTCGRASAGVLGTATAGDYGTASVGDRGTASAGLGGTVCAGEQGEIRLKYMHSRSKRYRTVTGYIGENGLEPNTPYRLNDKHVFARADHVGGLRDGQ